MKKYLTLLTLLFTVNQLFTQSSSSLQSGPMVGYAEMREVQLWLQTQQSAEVYIRYHQVGKSEPVYQTNTVQTQYKNAFTAHLLADQVQPGNRYQYDVYINDTLMTLPYPTEFNTPPLWQYRTDPPNLKIAMGSCAFINDSLYDRPGKPYGGGYQIFQSIYEDNPDLMLWLGDNVYLREADWYSKTGIIYRYTHTRSLPQMQPLLASTANYAIWDDHDYGPNNSDGSFGRKREAEDIFTYFWANPTYALEDIGGITTTFEWGDAQFFLLDNRYHRSPNNKQTEQRSLLGAQQLDWLMDALVSSQATFKFVCIGGQVLNDVAEFENYAHIAPEEREYILQTIVEEGIHNVVFLTGDRHHSEFSSFEQDDIKIYDFTVSPLTSGPHDANDEPNTLRVEGSHFGIRNYGTVELNGERLARSMRFTYFDVDGKELWDIELPAQYPE